MINLVHPSDKFSTAKNQSPGSLITSSGIFPELPHLEEEIGVADDDEERLGPGDGHVEPLRVPEESELVTEVVGEELGLRAHRRHDDHLPLLLKQSAMEPFAREGVTRGDSG